MGNRARHAADLLHYSVSGLAVASEIELPELAPAPPTSNPDLIFRIEDSLTAHRERLWLHRWSFPDGTPWLSVSRQEAEYVLRFPDLAEFSLSPCSPLVTGYAWPSVASHTIRHLLLDQVLPLFLSSRGKFVLHASAVATQEGAIVLIGTAGQGKSTLAAALTARGCRMITDDCALIANPGQPVVVPSYPGLRLWPDSLRALGYDSNELQTVSGYSTKKRLPLPNAWVAEGPVQLHRAYVLDRKSDHIKITRLSLREATMQLVRFQYILDITDAEVLRAHFQAAAKFGRQIRLNFLTFPFSVRDLPRVADAVLKDGLKA